MSEPKTILITGVSSGLGRAFAVRGLEAGYRVVGTVRQPGDASAFDQLHQRNAIARVVDLTDEVAVNSGVADVEGSLGPIDIVIANAGYGHEGLFEESTLDELRQQFEVNVFATVALIKAVLPAMRARRRGHILAVTSVGGLVTSPGLSFYHGSKFAMEGILESLGKEVAPLGIHVTAIEPGPFRTDWSGRSMTHSARFIEDYEDSYGPIKQARLDADGHQPGDPAKAAEVVFGAIEDEDPPRHLLLGSAAVGALTASRAAFDNDVRRWEARSRSADFAEVG